MGNADGFVTVTLPDRRADGKWWNGDLGPFESQPEAIAARFIPCFVCQAMPPAPHKSFCPFRGQAHDPADHLDEPRSDLNASEGPWSGGFADNH